MFLWQHFHFTIKANTKSPIITSIISLSRNWVFSCGKISLCVAACHWQGRSNIMVQNTNALFLQVPSQYMISGDFLMTFRTRKSSSSVSLCVSLVIIWPGSKQWKTTIIILSRFWVYFPPLGDIDPHGSGSWGQWEPTLEAIELITSSIHLVLGSVLLQWSAFY